MLAYMDQRIEPFNNCPALDGYHCQTSSLAKIFHFYRHPLSEEMILGLGAGMGYMYRHRKGTYPFTGGRGNIKIFFNDISSRTGVDTRVQSTSSAKKTARNSLFAYSWIPVRQSGISVF